LHQSKINNPRNYSTPFTKYVDEKIIFREQQKINAILNHKESLKRRRQYLNAYENLLKAFTT
jgi:hypothetical protein